MGEQSIDKHILVLDNKWHQVFNKIKTGKMKQLEKKLNQLLKEQSSAVTDLKALKIVKKDLMAIIMSGMSAESGKERRKLQKAKKKIEEVNQKSGELEKRLTLLPKTIYETNEALLDESMALYYVRIRENKDKLTQLESEIEQLRETIKGKMLNKSEMEETDDQLNRFLLELMGPDKMDFYDKKYL